MSVQLEQLKKKYSSRNLFEYYYAKYNVSKEQTGFSEDEKREKQDYYIFGRNIDMDKQQVNYMIEQIDVLENLFDNMISGENNAIYFKILGKCKEKLLEINNITFEEDMEVIVKEIVKVMNGTVINCFAKSVLYDCVDMYLKKCGFHAIQHEVGDVLQNTDYRYIKTGLLKYVSNKADINRILEKKHDAYLLNYYCKDEEEINYELIYGEYTIGARRK